MTVKRNVALLAACQSFLTTTRIAVVAFSGLVGYSLASDKRLATVPITAYIVGAAMSTLPASFFMKHHGRRAGFMLGAGFGMVGALLCALAVSKGDFWLFCVGSLIAGIFFAFGQQYRFAAADAAPPEWRSNAISLTLAGGVIGGVLGPETGHLTREMMAPPFTASFIALAGFALLSMLFASGLKIPPLPVEARHAAGRSIRKIVAQPGFVVALLSAAAGYGVMNLLMNATPLAMKVYHLPFSDIALVLAWHVLGMFVPSFFTGSLIKRYGVINVLICGNILLGLCVGIAVTGASLMHFWWALGCLGVGWNFLYIGGTTLLIETYRPEEKAKTQGTNDFVLFVVQAVSALSAGVLITDSGWSVLNFVALPAVIVSMAAALWLAWLWRRHPLAPA